MVISILPLKTLDMSALLPLIKDEIKTKGPLTVARYMDIALGHVEHGYYRKQDPFGVGGDFITAPEISQMFGEIIGLWAAYVWQNMGQPGVVNMVEVGPGRGTLMVDLLRAASSVPRCIDAMKVRLVETSPTLRRIQDQSLRDPSQGNTPIEARWLESVDDLDDGPVLVIGNEFFDALPIRQYVRTETGWQERLIGLKDGELAFELGAGVIDENLIPISVCDAPEESVFEDQAASRAIMEKISARIVAHGGAALFFDYGHDRHGLGDTLQALKNHQYVDVLADPGNQDLTTHVDFEQLSKAAIKAGACVLGPMSQGTFLEQMGMSHRATALKAQATQTQILHLNQAYSRLTSPEQMGTLFRVMAVVGPGSCVPPWAHAQKT